MGLAVSRKVGRAVVRNRVKRRIREIYRTHRNDIRINDGVGCHGEDVHMVIVARAASTRLNYHQSEDALRQLFQSNTPIPTEQQETAVSRNEKLEGDVCSG